MWGQTGHFPSLHAVGMNCLQISSLPPWRRFPFVPLVANAFLRVLGGERFFANALLTYINDGRRTVEWPHSASG